MISELQEGVNLGLDFAIDIVLNDAYAMSFVSIKQYREFIVKALREVKHVKEVQEVWERS